MEEGWGDGQALGILSPLPSPADRAAGRFSASPRPLMMGLPHSRRWWLRRSVMVVVVVLAMKAQHRRVCISRAGIVGEGLPVGSAAWAVR